MPVIRGWLVADRDAPRKQRNTGGPAAAGVATSVGSRGNSYDNALAETVNGLYKAALINRAGPWRSVEQVELVTAPWVHWWNTSRLHSACGDASPAEYEAAYRATTQVATAA